MNWVDEYGLIGLFVGAFLAATILPMSSEALLFGALELDFKPSRALFWASLGNCLGVVLNYFLGALMREKYLQRFEKRRVFLWLKKYGWSALLLSWAPFVGDPITILAGAFRIPFAVFVLVALPLRVLRYLLLIWPFL